MPYNSDRALFLRREASGDLRRYHRVGIGGRPCHARAYRTVWQMSSANALHRQYPSLVKIVIASLQQRGRLRAVTLKAGASFIGINDIVNGETQRCRAPRVRNADEFRWAICLAT